MCCDLVARPDVAIAGPTAGRLWGLRRLPADRRIHVIAPPGVEPDQLRLGRAVSTRPRSTRSTSSSAPTASASRPRSRTAFDLARFVRADDLRRSSSRRCMTARHRATTWSTSPSDWSSPRRRGSRTYLRQLSRRIAGGGGRITPRGRASPRRSCAPASAAFGRQHPSRPARLRASPLRPGRAHLRVGDRGRRPSGRTRRRRGSASDRRRDARRELGGRRSRITADDYAHDSPSGRRARRRPSPRDRPVTGRRSA